jgi:hypothetical protein
VEHELRRGLELARQRGSHSLSVRVATTLAQRLLERGDDELARGMLDAELARFAGIDLAGDTAVPRARALLEARSPA